ncbi:MAG: hypothetical protein ACD_86C00003G0014 [uncultured bacterium]|nr:MAG: hypothetical protein ACD_86C00003G0014 [uncultured bacterium]
MNNNDELGLLPEISASFYSSAQCMVCISYVEVGMNGTFIDLDYVFYIILLVGTMVALYLLATEK